MLLLSALGTFKPTAIARRHQARGDLSALPEKIALLQLALVPDSDVRLIAEGIERAAAHLHRPLSLSEVTSRLLHEASDALQPPYALARRLQEIPIEQVAAELLRLIPEGTQTVLFPPLMGIDIGWLDEIAKRLAIPCAEILASAPSVPGLRLQTAIDAAVRDSGTRLLEAEIHWTGERLATIDDSPIRAGSVVLATGGNPNRSKLTPGRTGRSRRVECVRSRFRAWRI